MLKAFQHEGKFPYNSHEVPEAVVEYVARQVDVPHEQYREFNWRSRNSSYQRQDIRAYCGFREFTRDDAETLTAWLSQAVMPRAFRAGAVTEAAFGWLRAAGIEPPSAGRLQRFVDSAQKQYDQHLCQTILERLSETQQASLDGLLAVEGTTDLTEVEGGDLVLRGCALQQLRVNSEKRGVESVAQQIEKLRFLRRLDVSETLFADVSPHVLVRYRERAATESPSHFRAQAVPVRLTLLAAFCVTRMAELTDALVTHLIDMVHHINVRAERRVEKKFVAAFRKVNHRAFVIIRL